MHSSGYRWLTGEGNREPEIVKGGGGGAKCMGSGIEGTRKRDPHGGGIQEKKVKKNSQVV